MAAFTMTASRPALASRAAPVTGLRARVTRRAPLRGARLAMRAEPSKVSAATCSPLILTPIAPRLAAVV